MEVLVVADKAEESRGTDAGDIDEGDQERRKGWRKIGDVSRVLAKICLRDTISSALKKRRSTIDPEGPMFEKLPGNPSSPGTVHDKACARCLNHKDRKDSGTSHYGGPYKHSGSEPIAIEEPSENKRTNGSYDVLGG